MTQAQKQAMAQLQQALAACEDAGLTVGFDAHDDGQLIPIDAAQPVATNNGHALELLTQDDAPETWKD